MSYKLQKALILAALFTVAGIIVSIHVGDLSLGFGLTAVVCFALYAAAVELQKK